MNELHHSRQRVPVGALAPDGAAEHQQQCRAQAFAPGRDDVLRHLPDQRHFGGQPFVDHLVNPGHVGLDQFERVARFDWGGRKDSGRMEVGEDAAWRPEL